MTRPQPCRCRVSEGELGQVRGLHFFSRESSRVSGVPGIRARGALGLVPEPAAALPPRGGRLRQEPEAPRARMPGTPDTLEDSRDKKVKAADPSEFPFRDPASERLRSGCPAPPPPVRLLVLQGFNLGCP